MSTVALEVLEGWAPTGSKIVGTYDKVPGVALAYTYYRDPVVGHVEAEYEGETKLWWNDCESQYAANGQRLFVDENDELWPEDKIAWKLYQDACDALDDIAAGRIPISATAAATAQRNKAWRTLARYGVVRSGGAWGHPTEVQA